MFDQLSSANTLPLLGGKLLDGFITDIHKHVTEKDRIVIVVTVTLPYPPTGVERFQGLFIDVGVLR